jgi:predicted transcriptional regulator
MNSRDLISLTAEIVTAHVENNHVTISDLPGLIANVHSALVGLGTSASPHPAPPQPATSVRASIKPDHLVCLEDGKKVKMLKRHLSTEHGLTPDEYRAKWNLPAGYPMVAPNYAEQRKQIALKIGLGQTRRGPAKRTPAKRKGK